MTYSYLRVPKWRLFMRAALLVRKARSYRSTNEILAGSPRFAPFSGKWPHFNARQARYFLQDCPAQI